MYKNSLKYICNSAYITPGYICQVFQQEIQFGITVTELVSCHTVWTYIITSTNSSHTLLPFNLLAISW